MPSDGKVNVPDLVPIRFTEVFDLGDGFDPTTGVYSVKYSGIYAINFQLFPDFTGHFAVDLKVNGNILVRARAPDVTSQYLPSCSSGVSVRVKVVLVLFVSFHPILDSFSPFAHCFFFSYSPLHLSPCYVQL